MAENTIGILCTDDNVALAESLRCLIEQEPDLRWLGHLVSTDGLIDEVRRHEPDVLLLDLALPGEDPFELMKKMDRLGLAARVLVLSGFISAEYVERAMDSGAWGYVAKDEGPDALIAAIRRVAAGEVAFTSPSRRS
jgi:DNA-binding NarL/FixJ family response regulator